MGQLRILHLEDSALDAELIQHEMARLDIESTWRTVASGEDFESAMSEGPYDAILSDNSVQGIDGLRALQVARTSRPGIPFVFVSGNADPHWAEHCLAKGATDYVPKDQLWRLPSALKRIHEAREAERLMQLTRGRALLIDAVKDLSRARSVPEIVDIVRRCARELNQADGATFVLRDGPHCHYVDEDAIGPLWKGHKFPLATCVSGWAMLNKQAAVSPDIYTDSRIPHDAYRPTFVKSLVMVPIRAEAPIGAIGNYWATPHQATEVEVELIQALADSTSLAFENVAAYDLLERRVQQRTAELEEANKELEAFSYSVSHDLRAPLRAVQGYSDLLATGVTPALEGQALTYLDHVRTSARRMGTLIEDMITLAKVSRTELRPRQLHIGALVRDILNTLKSASPLREVHTRVDTQLMADGDAGLLRLALENLLSNAWKFTSKRENAVIEFGAEQRTDGRTVYFVRDNGAGFDMARAQQLFEPFRRLHSEAEFAGTGVGLAIVQRVIKRHGGEVWADATHDHGACFYFTLSDGAA